VGASVALPRAPIDDDEEAEQTSGTFFVDEESMMRRHLQVKETSQAKLRP